MLEEYEHAKKRGAKIYAEVVGFGMSSDAYHMTSPPAACFAAAVQKHSDITTSSGFCQARIRR